MPSPIPLAFSKDCRSTLGRQGTQQAAHRLCGALVGIQPGDQRALLEKGIKCDHSLNDKDCQPYYARVGESWTLIDYSKNPAEWMKPLVRGTETDLIQIPGGWCLACRR